jgi:hypothetical protein
MTEYQDENGATEDKAVDRLLPIATVLMMLFFAFCAANETLCNKNTK